jgi:NTP pyrophosphatase (non-canonical NTP hydrolase)
MVKIKTLNLNNKGDYSLNISELQKSIHQLAIEKGWWEKDREIPELLCLIHSEISEALEAYRVKGLENWIENGKPEGVAVELADAIIRILDLAEYFGFNMEKEILNKHEYNKSRPYRHGQKKI